MSTTSRSLLISALALIATPLAALAEPVEISGIKFTAPEAFKAGKPDSPMRKAQFSVGEGEQAGEIVFFYFGAGGAGGVEANVTRWLGQFKEGKDNVNAKTEKAKAGETPVTFVSADGTFLSGPPSGPAVEKPDYALLGAIVEAKEGAVFAKFTGPKATVEANSEAFRKMITEAK
jgi:hypothetical protein